jgi:hypothetical protein
MQLLAERCEVARREMSMAILDQVEVFDQQIAPAWQSPQEVFDLLNSSGFDLAPLWD